MAHVIGRRSGTGLCNDEENRSSARSTRENRYFHILEFVLGAFRRLLLLLLLVVSVRRRFNGERSVGQIEETIATGAENVRSVIRCRIGT